MVLGQFQKKMNFGTGLTIPMLILLTFRKLEPHKKIFLRNWLMSMTFTNASMKPKGKDTAESEHTQKSNPLMLLRAWALKNLTAKVGF